MTKMMKKWLLLFGRVLFVDYMKRQYNKEAWPYCGPVILDGDHEIGVVGESLNLSESFNGYYFVLSSIFEMVPEFDPSSIKLFADDFMNISVLKRLGIAGTAVLRADLWHLTHEQLPKFFGSFWQNLEEPMKCMLHSGSEKQWDEAYNESVVESNNIQTLLNISRKFMTTLSSTVDTCFRTLRVTWKDWAQRMWNKIIQALCRPWGMVHMET
jgi:hypothetical protein